MREFTEANLVTNAGNHYEIPVNIRPGVENECIQVPKITYQLNKDNGSYLIEEGYYKVYQSVDMVIEKITGIITELIGFLDSVNKSERE